MSDLLSIPGLLTAFGLLVLLCLAAGVGAFVRTRLPEQHRSRESMQLVQLTITLLVTFTSIVLGLLTGSVTSGFDKAYRARGTYAAEFVQMDQCLRDYGPETLSMRQKLRAYVGAVIASTWPNEPPPKVSYPDVSGMPRVGESLELSAILNDIRTQLRELVPKDAVQARLLPECLNQFSDLTRSRWEVIEGANQSIAAPFYWVLALWLVILFGSFGLTAPPNPLTIIVVVLTALSITIAVAVIADLDQPYGGLFGIPSTAMRNALSDMMR